MRSCLDVFEMEEPAEGVPSPSRSTLDVDAQQVRVVRFFRHLTGHQPDLSLWGRGAAGATEILRVSGTVPFDVTIVAVPEVGTITVGGKRYSLRTLADGQASAIAP